MGEIIGSELEMADLTYRVNWYSKRYIYACLPQFEVPQNCMWLLELLRNFRLS